MSCSQEIGHPPYGLAANPRLDRIGKNHSDNNNCLRAGYAADTVVPSH